MCDNCLHLKCIEKLPGVVVVVDVVVGVVVVVTPESELEVEVERLHRSGPASEHPHSGVQCSPQLIPAHWTQLC